MLPWCCREQLPAGCLRATRCSVAVSWALLADASTVRQCSGIWLSRGGYLRRAAAPYRSLCSCPTCCHRAGASNCVDRGRRDPAGAPRMLQRATRRCHPACAVRWASRVVLVACGDMRRRSGAAGAVVGAAALFPAASLGHARNAAAAILSGAFCAPLASASILRQCSRLWAPCGYPVAS